MGRGLITGRVNKAHAYHTAMSIGGCTRRDRYIAARRHLGGAKVCTPLMSEGLAHFVCYRSCHYGWLQIKSTFCLYGGILQLPIFRGAVPRDIFKDTAEIMLVIIPNDTADIFNA